MIRPQAGHAAAAAIAKLTVLPPMRLGVDDLARLRREQPVALRAADELARRWKKLTNKSKPPRRLDVAERHKLRIRAKKLRYAVEFFADVFPGKKRAKRCGATLSSLKDLQDALGALNDVATREKLMSRAALAKRRKSKGTAARERAFAAGMVVGAQEAGIEHMLAAAESAYAKLLEVKPFWK
jgi:triphosphatase